MPDEDYEHIDELSRVYLGGRYQWTPERAPRFRVVIEPDRVRTTDIALPDREIR